MFAATSGAAQGVDSREHGPVGEEEFEWQFSSSERHLSGKRREEKRRDEREEGERGAYLRIDVYTCVFGVRVCIHASRLHACLRVRACVRACVRADA